MRAPILAALTLVSATLMGAAPASPPLDLAGRSSSLTGTWAMDSAYEIHRDGTRTTNYGEHPIGLMMVDRGGNYAIQIYRPGRPNFASGVKAKGEPDEYRSAVLGSSNHFGHVAVDAAKHQLQFDVTASSFPNWEGKRQVRDYTYKGGVLTYAVPASASGDGTIAYSVWRRLP